MVIRDLGSSNGTFVDGKRLSEEGKASQWIPLKNGSVIDFGVDLAFPDSMNVFCGFSDLYYIFRR